MVPRLAKITAASICINGGIFTFWLFVDYEEGDSQGIGGFPLDTYDKEKKKRIGRASGCTLLREIMEIMQVKDFNVLKGRHLWVYGEGDGTSFMPKGIAPLAVDVSRRQEPLFFKDILT